MSDEREITSENRDPITGEKEFHPAGTGTGAVLGGAAGIGAAVATGAALGTAAGPVGTVAGAAIGAVLGGLAGKALAEEYNPTEEDAYWRENYANQSYYEAGRQYQDYEGAYRTGYEGRARLLNQEFDEAEPVLRVDYERNRGGSSLDWERARSAAQASWDRVNHRYIDRR
ncbi:hypothetical protein [Chitiniphilus eburneus]|uniref:Glycine zipper domain-containing protein n=1 Tax=Chitiniphilus eburneus TaxID=2571148 RepID=A0A4U0PZD3_9NEIS|nr:hypothetical protein [Chitiniphilus eburneus]TJZ73977.1 hypothetical protein FAZ21_08450 [Chitiniphilus eburneus]